VGFKLEGRLDGLGGMQDPNGCWCIRVQTCNLGAGTVSKRYCTGALAC